MFLYAVYEAAVTEIGRLIKNKKCLALSSGDIRGEGFLDRSKRYFEHVLQFALCDCKDAWDQIVMMSEIRNAIAHANGRWDMIGDKAKSKIRRWEKQGTGIRVDFTYLDVSAGFVQKSFKSVQSTLDDLVTRYKKWDEGNPVKP